MAHLTVKRATTCLQRKLKIILCKIGFVFLQSMINVAYFPMQLFSSNMMCNFKIFAIAACFMAWCGCTSGTEKNTGETQSPNFLIIVADDLGFSDVGCFGGNIETPHIDGLGKEGLMFSNFHVLPTCSPTRSALLTGNDNHVAGLGIMSETNYAALEQLNLPGYAGYLSNEVTTIPEVLKEEGYHTYMTGKWHLGEGQGRDPHDRGFEETFILGTGGGSHWNDKKPLSLEQHMEYFRNGQIVEPPADFYSTHNYTDSMLQFIEKNREDGKPFFGYLSYTAVHDPLHAPESWIARYKGKFDMGWDSLWSLRLSNLKQIGIMPANYFPDSKNSTIPKWSSLPEARKKELARDMEVYAAMLSYMDSCIGRVLDYLKEKQLYDNTMVIFISDNGANGADAHGYPGNEDGKYLSTFNNELENRGLKNSYVEQGAGWAQASSSPYRFFKSFATEGGIRAPLIVKMPKGYASGTGWNKGFLHVTDIMPTILEITGATYPSQRNGIPLHALVGKSMMPVIEGQTDELHKDTGMGWELFEMKAYYKNGWKVLRLPVPFGTGEWELYNLMEDPAETINLSKQYPEKRDSLVADWKGYAQQNKLHDHQGHFDSLYRRNYNVDGEWSM
jgi:arylsulfatase A-like enzyme